VAERPVWRTGAGPITDAVAVEEPLEVRLAGDPVAVTMRTPGDDARLAAGFLHAEGLIRSLDDLGSLAHCGRPGEEGFGNVIDAIPAPGVVIDVERTRESRRGTLTTSACGVCGRRNIDGLLSLCSPLPPGEALPAERVGQALALLREGQAVFERTGGTHAAAALSAQGEVLALHEDVGRHNAVYKVVGARLYAARDGARRPAALLAVSGRSSFEIVQKAAVARIPVVASVSAPSSLAIDLAERAGIALCGFVREGAFNVYAHPERISFP
jgi:FdhD protein